MDCVSVAAHWTERLPETEECSLIQHHFMGSQYRFEKQHASTKKETAAVVLHVQSP